MISPNQRAFLDMLAFSEIGKALLEDPRTDRGYRVIVGSTPIAPILMNGYADHPRRLMTVVIRGVPVKSTAAGRYQEQERNYDFYCRLLRLSDFSPASQDAIALQQIRETGALPDIDAGHFQIAVAKVSHLWASLPGAGYHQHENLMGALEAAYERAGGTFA